ncbi:MAG: hypothetical protein HOC74_41155 [Gemmatimonadetes bacterium]|nr:hypothetical protein [Gemmatimonadota bacterium]
MPREDISVFCADHLPRKNVVVYEIVGESFQPGFGSGNDFYREPTKGWRMGVRYKRRPPPGYGLQAAEPNVGTTYLAEYRTKGGGHYYFTTYGNTRYRTEHATIQDALRNIEQRRARCVEERPSLQDWFDRDQRVWGALKAQCELRTRIETIALDLPLVRQLRESGHLVSLVLIGSLRNQDFVPGLSDIDLWILGRWLKPALRIELVEKYGHQVEVNLICRNQAFLRGELRQGTPVDLVALRYGQVLYDDGFFRTLRRKAHRYSVTPATREMWMKSSARWLSTAIYQYFHPNCPHCFFGALYHAGRDLLRAHLIAHGADLVEGWEIEAAIENRWPDLAEAFGRIRWARAHWQSYAFPQFKKRLQIESELGELLLSLEYIARSVYRSYGLRFPRFQTFFGEFTHRRGAGRFFSIDIRPDQETIFLSYENDAGKLKLVRRKIPRMDNNA